MREGDLKRVSIYTHVSTGPSESVAEEILHRGLTIALLRPRTRVYYSAIIYPPRNKTVDSLLRTRDHNHREGPTCHELEICCGGAKNELLHGNSRSSALH